jgi:hypothetical protein
MFLLFITLNGQPATETFHIEPLTKDCRNEMLFIRAMNGVHDENHTGQVFYGSCEPVVE